MPKAYSYLRFSSPEQMRGDSLRRQTQLAREYALRNGLTLDDKLTFHDLGVSAFRGRNAEAGRLGDFLEAVESGLVERGSYLLVESLDRISRQAARKALRVLEDLCESGVVVVTLVDGREYTAESLDDPLGLMVSLLTFIRANEESAMKARRLKAAWEEKRSKAMEKPLTAVCPPWLKLDKTKGKFVLVTERAAVVRRIFRDTLKGYGQHRVAETLNQEGVLTFGSSQFWRRTYIKTILCNPAVVGRLVPKTTEHRDGRRVRVAGQPIDGYFPRVVADEVYHRVQALRLGGGNPLRGRHAGGEVKNIFGGLVTCGYCGGTAVMVVKGNRYLVCERAKSGAGCQYRSVRYDRVERVFLDNVGWLLASAPAGDSGEELDLQLASIDASLLGVEDALERMLDEVQRGRSHAVTARIRELDQERDRLTRERGVLVEERLTVMGPMVQRRLEDLEMALKSESLDRTQVNALMRQVFSKVTLDHKNGLLLFSFKHGGEADVMFAWPAQAKPIVRRRSQKSA